ncbi:hypothetical protein [Bacillus wiedmannii]|uniref:hypothetical protein n=1 Tax=Bacillus wiedmannii TaxID=1890302 RepID=UPI0020D274F5|nr:hypothetical protein [Bacillus wiedmannii]
MKENATILQVLYIDDKVKWKHLKEYEMDKHEHTESHEHQPLCGDTRSIRKLQFATRRHVISIYDMGSIRNAKRIMRGLKPYVSKTMPGGPVLPIMLSVTGCPCSKPVGPVGN